MCYDLDVPGTREQKFMALRCGFLKRKLSCISFHFKHVKNANRSNQDKISFLYFPQSFHALFVNAWIIDIWHCFNMKAINITSV